MIFRRGTERIEQVIGFFARPLLRGFFISFALGRFGFQSFALSVCEFNFFTIPFKDQLVPVSVVNN
jgi:hypothetical protein